MFLLTVGGIDPETVSLYIYAIYSNIPVFQLQLAIIKNLMCIANGGSVFGALNAANASQGTHFGKAAFLFLYFRTSAKNNDTLNPGTSTSKPAKAV